MANQHILGKVEIVPIREVFKDEAQDFTTWLESNIGILGERLGVELSVVQREKPVGDFNVDLVCEDENGNPIVIENQLERTDHDHLGKLLTYLVNLNAKMAIWVSTESRPEHENVIDWLNEFSTTDISFYMVKVEAVRIGSSPCAPLFTVAAGPDKQIKEIGEKKKEWSDRHFKRLEFWKTLLEKSKGKTKLFSNKTPSRDHWMSTGAGTSGITFVYTILTKEAGIELYIDNDQETGQGNKQIFDELYRQKDAIEEEFGSPLDWQRLDDKRACRIKKTFTSGGLATPEQWPALLEEMIDQMVKFEKTMRSRVDRATLAVA